jgi:glucose-1-phosphate cytidylyltransferase
LCLGYKSDVIKNYFLNYNECLSNNFVLSNGCKEVTLLNTDIDDWRITFVDTGLHSNIGQRLRAVEEYLEGEEVFLANYSDGLSDAPLPDLIDYFVTSEKTASFLSVRPTQSFHVVSLDEDGEVEAIRHIKNSGIWINGGFFVFRKAIFRYINDGEELVNEPFQRLIERGKLTTYKHTGFWVSMDTFKDKQLLDDMCSRGETPWEVWKNSDRRECAP